MKPTIALVLLLTFALATQAQAQTPTPTPAPTVHTASCANATTCPTTWTPALGDLYIVSLHWVTGESGPPPTDSQSNPYTLLRQSYTYHSNRRTYATLATSTTPVTVTLTIAQDITILSAPGFTIPTAAQLASQLVYYPPTGTGGSSGSCPAPAASPLTASPLTLTTTGPCLLVSDWAMDSGTAQSCTSTSGTPISPTCGGHTSQLNYQLAPTPGTYSQLFTFNPGYNGGNTNCSLMCFPGTLPTPPPPPPTKVCNGLGAGDGIQLYCDPSIISISLDRGVVLPNVPYMSALIPGPFTTLHIPRSLHQIGPPCAISGVAVYDNEMPRNSIQIHWTIDPTNCEVVIPFATPQFNFYVVVR